MINNYSGDVKTRLRVWKRDLWEKESRWREREETTTLRSDDDSDGYELNGQVVKTCPLSLGRKEALNSILTVDFLVSVKYIYDGRSNDMIQSFKVSLDFDQKEKSFSGLLILFHPDSNWLLCIKQSKTKKI